MKTFKEYLAEEADNIERNWDDYARKNFNSHLGGNSDIKKNESGSDMIMRKLASAHKKTDEYSVHHIKQYLDDPKPLDDHFVASANSKTTAGSSFGDHNIKEFDTASRQHKLKSNVTVHMPMNKNMVGNNSFPVQTPHLGDISPHIGKTIANTSDGEIVRHVARVDIPQGTKVGIIGRAKDTEGNPVFPKNKNKIIIPRGGSLESDGNEPEKYRDSNGNAIHVHRYTFQQ